MVPTTTGSVYNPLPTFSALPNSPTALLCTTVLQGNGPGSSCGLQQGREGRASCTIPSCPVLSHPTPYLFLLWDHEARVVSESHPFGGGRLSRLRFAPQTKLSLTAILQHP